MRRPTRVRRWTLLLGCALILACSGGDDARSGVNPVVLDSAGVTIVVNSIPSWAPETGWRIGRQITSIGAVEGEPEYQLYKAWDATRLSDGTIAVANSGTSEIRFFDSDGMFIRSVGRSGGGPGEFRDAHALRALDHVEGDTLLAWDLYGQTMSVFAPDGRFVRSSRLRNTTRMYFLSHHYGGGVFADRTMLLALFSPDNPQGGPDGMSRQVLRFVRFSAEGDSLGVLGEFEGSDQYIRRMGDSGMQIQFPPFGRILSVRVAGAMAYVATGDSYEIAVYGAEGDLRTLVRREHSPVAVTDALLEWQLEREISNHSEGAQQGIQRNWRDMPMPETLPPYHMIEVDTDLNLWVQDYSAGENAANEWSVFDPQGAWLGTVSMPPGFELYEIGADYILGKETDELEVEYITVYALVKP